MPEAGLKPHTGMLRYPKLLHLESKCGAVLLMMLSRHVTTEER
jgi:hypothetical protein